MGYLRPETSALLLSSCCPDLHPHKPTILGMLFYLILITNTGHGFIINFLVIEMRKLKLLPFPKSYS
jgi:hypothetical protein